METATTLSADRVHEICKKSLFIEGEDTSTAVRAEGIMATFHFNPARLETYRAEIVAMLNELPETFMQSSGGGWSFLNACMDKHGNHWAEHPSIDQLFCLGMAIGKVKCAAPREMWSTLPGGMPYYIVLD